MSACVVQSLARIDVGPEKREAVLLAASRDPPFAGEMIAKTGGSHRRVDERAG